MKIKHSGFLHACSAGVPLLGLWLLATVASGQSCQTVPIDQNDGLTKAPHSYELLYETDDVRVLEARIPPGETQAMHSFARPAILYLPVSVTSKTYSPGVANPIEHEEDKQYQPTVVRINAVGLYATQNLSKRIFYGLRVELKHPGCGNTSGPSEIQRGALSLQSEAALAHDRILYDDPEIRVTEVSLKAGDESESKDHLGFYYFPGTSPTQKTNANNSMRSETVLPFGTSRDVAQAHATSTKPLHAIRFELKYSVRPESEVVGKNP